MSHNTITYQPPRIALRADGSRQDGLGHLQRQLTLARTLRDRFAWEPIFFSATAPALEELFDRPDEFRICGLSAEDMDGVEEAGLCREHNLQLLMCDLKQPINKMFVKTVQQAGTRVWLYGNSGPGRRAADRNIFAFPAVAAALMDDYAALNRTDSPDNTMMPPVFARLRRERRNPAAGGKLRIFLSMGGADHAFLSGRVVDALCGLDRPLRLDCVVGPSFTQHGELEKRLSKASFAWRVHQAPEHFAHLASSCDLALTQMGNTVAELNCLGVPVLLLNSTEFHDRVAELYCRDGSAANLGRADRQGNEELSAKLRTWFDDRPKREALGRAGREKIDGRGTVRVAEALFAELQKDFVLVPCDACGSDDFEPLHLLNGRPMVGCCECGLNFMNVRPAPHLLQQVYASEYFTAPRTQKSVSNYEADKPNVLRFARARLDVLERLLPGKGRLLDVGCALGFYLQEASDRGWQVAGMDISDYAVAFTRELLNSAEVRQGTVETLDYPEERFDAIICSLVFEHFLAPRECLAKMTDWLRPGGILVIKVPHAGGVMCRFTPDRWFGSHPDNHFCDYTPDTLSRLLIDAGIRPMQWETEGIYLERFLDALNLNELQRSQILQIEGLAEKYRKFAAHNLLGDSLVVYGRKL